MRGEATPDYARYPTIPGVPERVHSTIPEVKLSISCVIRWTGSFPNGCSKSLMETARRSSITFEKVIAQTTHRECE